MTPYGRSYFEYSVILSNGSSEWFPVKSGVRQGCILLPILFLVLMDWVMRKTTSDKPRGIQLEDLDFADYLAFLVCEVCLTVWPRVLASG